MLGLEGLGADHGLPDVPLGPLPDLDPQLVRPGVQVPLQPDISSVRTPGLWLMHIILSTIFYISNTVSPVENIFYVSFASKTHGCVTYQFNRCCAG